MSKKRKYSVLVVDDETSVLFTYRILLEQNGYEANGMLSSREAIAALSKEPFDLLLCDLSLEEGHTGFEVLEHARRAYPKIPCVLLTGYATSDEAQKAERLGIPVMYKPIEIEEFLQTIAAVLREAYEQTASSDRANRAQASQSGESGERRPAREDRGNAAAAARNPSRARGNPGAR